MHFLSNYIQISLFCVWNITSRVENSELPQARETPSGKERIQNCDFSRCRLDVSAKANIQHAATKVTNMLYLSSGVRLFITHPSNQPNTLGVLPKSSPDSPSYELMRNTFFHICHIVLLPVSCFFSFFCYMFYFFFAFCCFFNISFLYQ